MRNYLIGLAFITLQIASVLYSQFIPERFFCWSPYDNHSNYKIEVELNNIELSENEIKSRYHYKAFGWEARSMYNIFSIIQQYENTYGKDDHAKINVEYSINGKEPKVWKLNN